MKPYPTPGRMVCTTPGCAGSGFVKDHPCPDCHGEGDPEVGVAAAAPDYPLLMVQAEIASGKATVRSLGALYMVAMAQRGSREGEPFASFADINGAIMDHRCPDGDAAARAMSLEPVKKVAWSLYEAMCTALLKARTAGESDHG